METNKEFRPSQEDWTSLSSFVKLHPELLGPHSKYNELLTFFAISRCPQGDEPRTGEAYGKIGRNLDQHLNHFIDEKLQSFQQRISTAIVNSKRGTTKNLDLLTLETLKSVEKFENDNRQ